MEVTGNATRPSFQAPHRFHNVWAADLALTLGALPGALAQPPLPATFRSIDFPGAGFTTVIGNNERGDLVGRYITGGVQHGYLLSGGVFTTIDSPGASLTQANGINP